MILGIGNDIVETERIRKAILRHPEKFLDRVFTEDEQKYCLNRSDPPVHFAGHFAAKEAVAKAFGTGLSQGITWTDIEIGHDERGKPVVRLSPFAADLFGNPKVLLSISHVDRLAIAFAIVET